MSEKPVRAIDKKPMRTKQTMIPYILISDISIHAKGNIEDEDNEKNDRMKMKNYGMYLVRSLIMKVQGQKLIAYLVKQLNRFGNAN